MATEYNWVYGEDWSISISIEKEIDLDQEETSVYLPEQLLRKQTRKNDIIEVEILAWDDIMVKIDVLIYNSLYLNHKYVFLNSTSVDIRGSSRASYGTRNAFVAD